MSVTLNFKDKKIREKLSQLIYDKFFDIEDEWKNKKIKIDQIGQKFNKFLERHKIKRVQIEDVEELWNDNKNLVLIENLGGGTLHRMKAWYSIPKDMAEKLLILGVD